MVSLGVTWQHAEGHAAKGGHAPCKETAGGEFNEGCVCEVGGWGGVNHA